MRAAFAIAALAGSAIAAPGYGYGQPKEEVQNVHVIVETVVQTVYVTEGYEVPAPTKPVYEAPAQPTTTTVVYEEPKPQYPTYEAPAPAKPTPTPEAPKPSAPATPPPSGNTGYMAIVDEYRQKMEMKALTWDSTLEANAKDTVDASHGEMVHKLNKGSMGQVLAKGGPNEFKHVFVGGWLCEVPSVLKGASSECSEQSQGWNYMGQTGHAKILSDNNYSKIGCACTQDVWSCDLA